MTDVRISDVIPEITQFRYNPAGIQRVCLDVLKKVSDDSINLVDPTNPFVFCLESSAVNAAVFMQENQANTRRLYPSAALDVDDLYFHMSDKDYVDRFAIPSSADFTMVLSKSEVINSMIDTSEGYKKIVIPRNTIFKIANVDFSIQYPIEIRLLTNQGIQVVYDNKIPSVLQPLTTNLIDYDVVSDTQGNEFLRFTVNATQFKIETVYNDVSHSGGFYVDIPIDDNFYYARCYVQDDDGEYREIITTHNDEIYDPSVPTMVLKVLDKTVRVSVPVVYITSGMIRGKVRVDVYQTKGELNMLLSSYKPNEFGAIWYNINPNENDVYNTAIRRIRTLLIYSTSHVNSGRKALSFKDLKARVIKNAIGSQSLPITNVQLQASVENMGYEITKNVDTVTNRIFLASRKLPKPTDAKILTSAASAMATAVTSMKEAALAYGVYDNNTSVTITSSALYQNVAGVTTLVSDSNYKSLFSLPLSERCKEVSSKEFFYSPFTYVMDVSTNTFEFRAYYLDKPTVEAKNFIRENASTGMQVSVSPQYRVEKLPDGYAIIFGTKSSSAFRLAEDNTVFAQLALKSKNQSKKVYLLGEQIKKDPITLERYYRFKLTTNYMVDVDDYIQFVSLESQNNGLPILSQLLQDFDLFFITTTPMSKSYKRSKIDDEIGAFQFTADQNPIGVTHEQFKIRFGDRLKSLWSQSRSVVSTVPYKVYPVDVLAYYPSDVYEIDPVTGTHFTIDDAGKLSYNILHKRGEPMLSATGEQLVRYRRGEVILDSDNNPIPVDGFERYMTRIVDILLIEGAYAFATDTVINKYKDEVVSSLVQWITKDLSTYEGFLLDQTKIYFYPKVNSGNVKIINSSNETVTIASGQSLKVKLFVPPTTYNDYALREALVTATIKTIDLALQEPKVAVSEIEYQLRDQYKSDVIDVEVAGIGGNLSLSTLTVLDNANRLSIRKRLTALADNTLVVEEDISVVFIKHGFDV